MMRPPRDGIRRRASPGNAQLVVGVALSLSVVAFIVLRSFPTRFMLSRDLPQAPRTMVYASGEDPRMDRALAASQQRWPEFVAAFRAKRAGDHLFTVQARLTNGPTTELTWILATEVDDETIRGIPESAAGHPEQAISVPASAVNDWMFTRDGEVIGGFTMKALQEMQGL